MDTLRLQYVQVLKFFFFFQKITVCSQDEMLLWSPLYNTISLARNGIDEQQMNTPSDLKRMQFSLFEKSNKLSLTKPFKNTNIYDTE